MTKRHTVTRFLMSSLAPNVWIFDEVYTMCVCMCVYNIQSVVRLYVFNL